MIQIIRRRITQHFFEKKRWFGTAPNSQNSSLQYCMDIVRQHDYENYLATLLLKGPLRSCALAVRAFNVEVARVHAQTKDKKIGEMRLQFWSHTLDSIYSENSDGKIPANPVAIQLHKVCKVFDIKKYHLNKLIQCRKESLQLECFNSITEMEKYCDESVTPIYFIILEAAGIKTIDADHAASHLGKAQGITNFIRSFNQAKQSGMIIIPQDILIRHGVSHQMILRGDDNSEMRNAIFELACSAMTHLRLVRKISIPDEAKSIFLPATPVGIYLDKLQRCFFNLNAHDVNTRNIWLPFNLYWSHLLSKY